MGVVSDMFGDDILTHPLMYRGVVEDVNDPEKAGRVKIRVLGVHSDNKAYVKTEQLPWAIPATDLRFGGGLRNIGSYKVPDVGSHVFLFFEAGDHNFPVYFAAAPAIEDVEDYQQKEGKLQDTEYEYAKSSQYDDKTNYSDEKDQYETPKDEQIEHPVQDYPPQTRKNTFGDGGSEQIPPPIKTEEEVQPLFPSDFFQEDIRIAFDGKANLDAPGYDGIHTIKPSSALTQLMSQQELDLWNERKWGHNDDDDSHQHDFEGGDDWKPEYPMCSTERNSQGEIVDRDILKERHTYIHPSKYFTELIQLDSSREKDDFLNERSIKKVYERQRGKGNSPDGPISTPYHPPTNVVANLPDPIQVIAQAFDGRKNNDITYDDIEGSEREQVLGRFEERKHNPGREKTVIEDFVYRYYANKVNETFNVDRNTRMYTGNDNMEIEIGDRNYRQHRGSHNQHLDIGNHNITVNKGWAHMHLDDGHHFIELNGERPFETSGQHEAAAKMDTSLDYQNAQHTEAGVADKGIEDTGSEILNTRWQFDEITYNETQRGSQFFLLHESKIGGDANQTFRLRKGHQCFHLHEGNQTYQLDNGNQGFHLKEGHQYYLLNKGDQRFELCEGDMERWVNGFRYTYYQDSCVEVTAAHWEMRASEFFRIQSSTIVLDGDVRITGQVQIDGNVKCGVIDSPGSPNMIVSGAVIAKVLGNATPPGGSASVDHPQDGFTLPTFCPGYVAQ
jgi:hypothetical protein